MSAADFRGDRLRELRWACLIPYELSLMRPFPSATMPHEIVAGVVPSIRNYPADSGGE